MTPKFVVPGVPSGDPEIEGRETREADMELTHYKKLRTAVQSNSSPANAEELTRLEQTVRDSLMATGYFEEVEVEHTDNLDGMVIAMCKFPSQMSESQVAAKLEQAWEDRLRFQFWEAHATLVDFDQVEFQGATRTGTTGAYATIHIVAQKAPIPAQRLA